MDVACRVVPGNRFISFPDAGGEVLLNLGIFNLVRSDEGACEGVSISVRQVNCDWIEADCEIFLHGPEGQGEEAEALLHGAQFAHVKGALVGCAGSQRF